MNRIIQSEIWVFAEQRQGQLADVGLELLGKALSLAHPIGWRVGLVLLGHNIHPLSVKLSSFGADEIVVVDHPILESYCSNTYIKVLAKAVQQFQPEAFLFGATAMGTDLSARLAARLRTGLSAHCIDLRLSQEKKLLGVVPGWGGNVLATVYCPRTQPQIATVMPGVFGIPEVKDSASPIIPIEADLNPGDITYHILETKREEVRDHGLEEAEVVIAGGCGIGSKEDWRWVEDLASALGGVVGATRPPVDDGWAKENQMIGQSGRTVHPKLYVGIGISGQMHHMVGIRGAEIMVGINADPNAPVFEFCDLGLVGDFKEIIPHLIKAIRAYSESNKNGNLVSASS